MAHLASGDVSVLIDLEGLPSVAYWGARLPDDPELLAAVVATSRPGVTNSSFDHPRRVSVLPGQHDGWSGTPALEAHVAGRRVDGWIAEGAESISDDSLRISLLSGDGSARTDLDYGLDPTGVLRCRARVTNTGSRVLDLSALRLSMPLPRRASEIGDFTGRWIGERRDQRQPVRDGSWTRAAHRGRPGHDAAYLTVVGTSGFRNGEGEVWSVHVGWSGDPEHTLDRLPEGVGADMSLLLGAENLSAGEIRLGPAESYATPVVHFAYSASGTDGLRRSFHRLLRDGSGYPRSPRPLVLNTWEAVYWDHRPVVLDQLAERAASIGVERFVLDDGWFAGRDDDTRGLGDWQADARIWPDGLRGLSDRVHELGMQFGIWVEPEMVNLDSDLARRHPDWVLAGFGEDASWRHQFVLDLSVSEAYEHVLGRLDEAVGAWRVDFLKWDHNRELTGAAGVAGAHSVHRQTHRFYALLRELRRRHPGLEIESCASGGGRVDLGVLELVQRIWPSDTNDPVERVSIQQHTGLLVPPELIGTHVGPPEAHTTHRRTSLGFRLLVALFGHAGIEWDLLSCTDAELAQLRRWAALYQELRPLLHAGITRFADDLERGETLMTVGDDSRDHVVATYVRTDASAAAGTPRLRLPGVDPARRYAVRLRPELPLPQFQEVAAPGWLPLDGTPVEMPGRVLGEVGVPLPRLNPQSGILLELTAL